MRPLIKRAMLHRAVKDQNGSRAPIFSPYGSGQAFITHTNKYRKEKRDLGITVRKRDEGIVCVYGGILWV